MLRLAKEVTIKYFEEDEDEAAARFLDNNNRGYLTQDGPYYGVSLRDEGDLFGRRVVERANEVIDEMLEERESDKVENEIGVAREECENIV